jgi:hypothetical protein
VTAVADKETQGSQISRAPTSFVGKSHSYYLGGDKLAGVSSVAKIGDQDAWGVASAWGFRIGYEGAYEVFEGIGPAEEQRFVQSKDHLRELLQRRGATPWATRDKAGDRGTWVHDVLEGLGQSGEVDLSGASDETRPHAQAVCKWFVDYRPQFVATEVQVVSERHRFAGRYDVRALISAKRLLDLFEDHDSYQEKNVREMAEAGGDALCLIDLKTSKRCYPTSHFPQLSGYEVASREMGFPATQAQFVLNTHPDGTYDFIPSWSNGEDFLDYLAAFNAIKRIQANDPETRRQERLETKLIGLLPGFFGPLKEATGIEKGPLLGMLKSLKKRGLIEQVKGEWRAAVNAKPSVGDSQ